MLRTLLTLFKSQPSRIVNKIEGKITGETSGNNSNKSIKNF